MNLLRNIILLCFLSAAATLPAQTVLPVTEVKHLPRASAFLARSPRAIQGRLLEQESVLDLARPMLLDSVVEKKKQRHPTVLGWGLKAGLGLCWEYIDAKKHTYIGSSSRTMQVFDGMAKEVDINLFLMPHLPFYVGMARNAFDLALVENEGNANQFRIDNPPYPGPEELRYNGQGFFTIECEVTPPEICRKDFDSHFMPLMLGANHLETHPNFGEKYPAFGTMGTLCLDCNHNCRPEIHPIEWLWWLDMAPGPDHPDDWQWLFGLVHDGSERFEDWSAAPLEGQMAIPVRIPASCKEYALRIEALLAEGMHSPKAALPAQAAAWKSGEHSYRVGEDGPVLRLSVVGFAGCESARWWLTPFQRDSETGDFYGELVVAAAAEHVFAARLSAGVR